MKKAVQYIQETFLILEDDKPALSLPDIWAIIEDHLEDRFKEYGRQCAEQALKEAAEKATLIYESDCTGKISHYGRDYGTEKGEVRVDPDSITSTKIITP